MWRTASGVRIPATTCIKIDPDMSAEQPNTDEDGDEDIRYFVRIGQADLDGTKSVERSLTGMNGIGRRAARVIADEADIDRTATLGRLEDDEIDAIVELVEDFGDQVPDWLTNRRRDFYTGETTHETGNDLEMSRRHDINRAWPEGARPADQVHGPYRGVHRRQRRGHQGRGRRGGG
ncbi:30S ribosomal protein S13 [Halobacteriales archaeon QH_2_65_14]|nr:MAG: 30S ribosomal protein S13 [Halobacteriales archaeon QH_2_65_14]